jgi:hypothetical protein
MVKWENDKNAYILGAALGASNVTISNEIAETIRAGWRKFLIFLFTLPSPFLSVLSRCICYTFSSTLLNPYFPCHSMLSHFSLPSSSSILSLLLLFIPSCLSLPYHSFSFFVHMLLLLFSSLTIKNPTNITAPTASTLGETPTLRAVKDQIKKLSISPSTSTTTTVKKSGVKKPKAAAAKTKVNTKASGKGKKRALSEDDSDDAQDGDKEGDEEGDEDEETLPAKKKQKVFVVKKEVEVEDDEGEI